MSLSRRRGGSELAVSEIAVPLKQPIKMAPDYSNVMGGCGYELPQTDFDGREWANKCAAYECGLHGGQRPGAVSLDGEKLK